MKVVRIIFFPVLLVLSVVYYLFFRLLRLKSIFAVRYSASCKVVCVGNATVGGSGKTEIVKKIVYVLKERARNVVVITKGYKRKSKEEILCLNKEYENRLINAEEYGDEPAMLFNELNVPVVVGKDKNKIISYAMTRFMPEVIISDDGYQNFSFYKDVNILVVNAKRTFWDKFMLPLGNLREPLKESVKRADLVVLNHVSMVKDELVENLRKKISKYNRDVKVVNCCYRLKNFVNCGSGEVISKESFKEKNQKVVLVVGVGFPESVEFLLFRNGFEIVQQFLFPDHYWYKKKQLEKILSNYCIVTTKKDAMRITSVIGKEELLKKVFVMEIDPVFLEGRYLWEEMVNNL